jgi:histidine ammonia-lyase
MNGTSVMTALACLAYDRAFYLAKLAARATSLAMVAMGGNKTHFSEKLFATKPHPGQTLAAGWIRKDISDKRPDRHEFNKGFQDRYSLRCAPHIIGVLLDVLSWVKDLTEIEINSANDNPLIDAESKAIMHGGHFYGGHIAIAMDTLKTAVANIADLLDRQLALLVEPSSNNGLPANLTGANKTRRPINHGLKALQIGASAWTAEALKLTMPASVFSRSTESHNQDKVSMGTISARDAIRVLELTEQTAAASLLAAAQATELRIKQKEVNRTDLGVDINLTIDQIRQQTEFLTEDRPLDSDLRRLLACISKQSWQLF